MRDTLYNGLPPNIKTALRSRLPSADAKEEVCNPDHTSQYYSLLVLLLHAWCTLFKSENFTIILDLRHNGIVLLQLTVAQIKAEMEKTLHWLVPVAADTTKYVTPMSNESQD